jgi:hypothetical protein
MLLAVGNAGVSREISAQGLRRFDAATKDADGVVIQFGGNAEGTALVAARVAHWPLRGRFPKQLHASPT